MQKLRTPKLPSIIRKPDVLRLLVIALLAEIAYAVLNISTMPVYLVRDRGIGEDQMGLVVVAFLLSEAIFKGLARSIRMAAERDPRDQGLPSTKGML